MKTLIHSLLVLLLVYSTVGAQQPLWEEQTSGTTNLMGTISAVDHNVCWIGAAGGVVLRTTDGGTNWINVGGGAIGNTEVYNIFAWDANLALCTTTPTPSATFVYRTTNGGTTWTQVFTQIGGFIDNIWLTSETNGFMQGDPVGSRWSLWRTTNGGVTWDSTGLFLPQVGTEAGWNNAMYVDGSTIYFGTNNSKVYYSSNNGASWTPQPMPLTNSFGIWFNSPSFGLVAGSIQGIVYTTNGGTSWSPMTIPTGSGTTFSVTGYGSQWYYIRGSEIVGSTNNGGTWTTAFTAAAGNYICMRKARSGDDVAWASRDNGGITKGTNIFAQEKWQLQNSNFPANVTVTNFSPVNDLVCWAGGIIIGEPPYPGYIRTIDGGNTWICDSIPGIPNGLISQVFAIDANTAYMAVYVLTASDSKGIYKTTDGGNNWTKQNAYSTALNGPGNIYFFDASNGVVIGDPFLETYTTTNGGQTWNQVNMPQALSGEYTWTAGSVIASHGNSVWFHTTHRMFRSTDRGHTWTPSAYDPLHYLWLPCIAFQDENTGIYSLWNWGTTQQIYRKTTNGGSTWTDFSDIVLDNITPTCINHIPGTAATYLVSDGTGSTRGSAATFDAGENWILWDTDNFGCWTIGFSSVQSGWGSIRQTNQVYKYIGPPLPVPVELTSFTATANGNEVILNWSTATELNNQGFEIERSEDNIGFNKIGFVPGFGTTTEPKSYSYSDQSLNNGTNYYRLKQIDYDGSYEYSDVLEVDFRTVNSYLLEQCYPNPFNPKTTIGFGIQNKSNIKITILNAIGEEVAVVLNEERVAGFHQVEFNASNLPSGVYFYQLKAGDFNQTKKMILMK